MKHLLSISACLMLASFQSFANESVDVKLLKEQVESLQKQLLESNAKIEALSKELKSQKNKDIKRLKSQISELKVNTRGDNVKFSVDFRNSYNYIHYKLLDGTNLYNKDLINQRLLLNMKAQTPVDGLRFFGQIGYYKTWGGNKIPPTEAFQDVDWRALSRPDNSIFRVKEAYFIHSVPDTVFTYSVGRRPSTDGFLANYREGNEEPNSPLAHITNMEVDMGMVMVNLDGFFPSLTNSYFKLVYGKAHDNVNSTYSATPYIYNPNGANKQDKDVRMLVGILQPYNDGQYAIIAQQAVIFNSKGKDPATGVSKTDGGTTYLGAVSVEVNGIGDEISEFLDNTTVFASLAYSMSDPYNDRIMSGSHDSEVGYSWWIGTVFPDMITSSGKLGIEYNHGTRYWTPMTWAEDTIIGSKLAVRGDAYEMYWNFPILGAGKFLTGQIRYTYMDFSAKANTICYWDNPTELTDKDLDKADNLRVFIRYRY